ncbi:hypothetical protein M231_03927 [Tremella mesenterica]|uniref:F-box domain-containing protein n=1 Tax=Tremella mesenterica TaxID=5217 RepID=A0A4Q1BLS4_TREME|nr:uncharacterized protein TREMEDRAFT_64833 [Tremella mesenterica DSM 1558]EIW66973.1 hypothetical protein TREMEDRAFT_64833 [Tremella mesenterica DSM 1558]RXK38751.1 hypothetical protein M231_03927 [Tremella mesenterica]
MSHPLLIPGSPAVSTPPLDPSGRLRSDTLVTSSSIESDQLQTPQTPTILGVMERYAGVKNVTQSSRVVSSPDGINNASDGEHVGMVQDASIGELRDGDEDVTVQHIIRRTESYGFSQVSPSRLETNLDSTIQQSVSTSPAEEPSTVIRQDEAEPLQTSQATPLPPLPRNDNSLTSPGQYVSMTMPEGVATVPSTPVRPTAEHRRSRSSLKDVVRRKLNRSKSSLKSLHTMSNASSPDEYVKQKEKGRFRSLLSLSLSRSQSALSLRSVPTTSSRASSVAFTPLHTSLVDESDTLPTVPTVDEGETIDVVQELEMISVPFGGPREYLESPLRFDDSDMLVHKARVRVKNRSQTVWNMNSMAEPVLSRPRAKSMPVFRYRKDLFNSILPRELKLVILSHLLEGRPEGNRRWDGAVGGRRELIKLSRVCKSWESLCFDGQLWTEVDLSPYAAFLHPNTLQRILTNTVQFMTSLSFRGMDNLLSSHLASLTSQGIFLPNLLTVDLRGCKLLHSDDICAIISAAPQIRQLNLKGVQAVNPEVITSLLKLTNLESLDVSRCWQITLSEISTYLESLSDSQADKLRILKVAGLNGVAGIEDFLSLIAGMHLSVLDMTGVLGLWDHHITAMTDELEELRQTATFTHLALSSTMLSGEGLRHLSGKVPKLKKLELADMQNGMPFMPGDASMGLVEFLRSCQELEMLDLSDTGSQGAVTDLVLEALPSTLKELRIGFAKAVTLDGLMGLLSRCPKLEVLEVDGTSANNAFMREFLRQRPPSPRISLSLVDCRAITPSAYSSLAPISRSRRGFTGHAASVFAYDAELVDKPVLKTFWSWRRVGVPRVWRDEREAAGRVLGSGTSSGAGDGGETERRRTRGKRKWWKAEEDWDDTGRGGCVVM